MDRVSYTSAACDLGVSEVGFSHVARWCQHIPVKRYMPPKNVMMTPNVSINTKLGSTWAYVRGEKAHDLITSVVRSGTKQSPATWYSITIPMFPPLQVGLQGVVLGKHWAEALRKPSAATTSAEP